MQIRLLIVNIFALLLNIIAGAQITISGIVRNEAGSAVPYATVNFKLDTLRPAKKYCIASELGKFELNFPSSWEKGYLEVSAVGYNTKIIFIGEIESSTLHVEVLLTTSYSPMKEVIIKIDPPISITKDTVTFKADFFKRGNEDNVAQLLKNMPGFIVQDNGRIIFNGKPINKILIEGDDLTGNNYEELANNLAVDGIDKIQVIDNYSDPTKVITRLTPSNEQVLNIKFKNGFLGTLFGALEGSAGSPINKNEFKSQLVLLKKASKIITINGYNSLGNLNAAYDDFSGASNSEIETSEISLKTIEPVAKIEDITSEFTDQKLIHFNKSYISSTNYSLKLSKKVSIRGTVKCLTDDYHQTMTVLNQILILPQPINIYQTQDVEKNIKNCSISSSINYLINNRNQILFLISTQNEKVRQWGTGELSNDSYEQRINSKKQSIGIKVNFTHLFKTNGAITSTAELQKGRLPSLYFLRPPNYDSFFHKTLYQNIEQYELQSFTSLGGNISILKKYSKNAVTISLNGKTDFLQFKNAITAYNSVDDFFNVRKDSTNNISFPHTDISVKLVNDHKVSVKSNLIVQGEILRTFYGGVNAGFKKTMFLHSVIYNIQLSKLDRVAFLYTSKILYPEVLNIASNYTITSLTGIVEGSKFIYTAPSQTFQCQYSHIDFLNKGFLFFSNFSYLNRPLLYLTDAFPGQKYTFLKYKGTDKRINMISLYSGANKFFSGMKNRLSTQIAISKGNTFGILKSIDSRIQFIQLHVAVDFKFQTKKIGINSDIKLDMTSQKIFNYGDNTNAKKFANTETVNIKISTYLFFDASFQTNLNIAEDNEPIYYFLANTAITANSKNAKWRFGLKINNLLDQDSYSYSVVLPYQTYFTEYRLLPRAALLFAKFKF